MPKTAETRIAFQHGFTLVEVAVTLLVMGLILSSFVAATSTVLDAREAAHQKEVLTRDAALAMQRLVMALKDTTALSLPMVDNPATAADESIREQRIPALAGFEKQTAVLAVRLSPTIDRDGDGIPDADNDADGQIDEDPGADSNKDGAPGIANIDDDNDGEVDEGLSNANDDEDDFDNEDPLDGSDDDKDGSIDEDSSGDLNDDKAPGVFGADDDGDGQIDEGSSRDDDEDGVDDEDWYDTVVFYLKDGDLIERQPYPYDVTGNGKISGNDFIEAVIANNVSYFRVERIDKISKRQVLVDIELELRSTDGQVSSLSTRVRVGGGI